MLVENRPGAGGLVGTDYVFKQPADGDTLLVSHAWVHVYATATRRAMPFDPVHDFAHIGMLVEPPMVLLVRAQSPFQTSAPKGLSAPIVQRLSALIPEILAKADVIARLEELQTLPRKAPVLRNDFVQIINSQIETWRAVAKKANVEAITQLIFLKFSRR